MYMATTSPPRISHFSTVVLSRMTVVCMLFISMQGIVLSALSGNVDPNSS